MRESGQKDYQDFPPKKGDFLLTSEKHWIYIEIDLEREKWGNFKIK